MANSELRLFSDYINVDDNSSVILSLQNGANEVLGVDALDVVFVRIIIRQDAAIGCGKHGNEMCQI